jgi:hypothetical protein
MIVLFDGREDDSVAEVIRFDMAIFAVEEGRVVYTSDVLILQHFEFVVEIASKRPDVCAPEEGSLDHCFVNLN